LAVPGGSGVPSASATGIPLAGPGGSAAWNCLQNGTVSGLGVVGGVQYGATGPGPGGNVNYLSAASGTGGLSANLGMPPSYFNEINMPNSGVAAAFGGGGNVAAGSNDVSTLAANMNVASTAGANVAASGFGVPGDHNPTTGGVQVLPDVSTRLLLQELDIFKISDDHCTFNSDI